MTEEYQWVVDDEDKELYKTTREEVVEKGLLHRGVLVFVFNSEGKFFVQKRSKNKKLFPGLYVFGASGGVSLDETYEEAALRELEEELGIKDVEIEYLFDNKFRSKELNNNIKVYKCVYDGEIVIEENEIESGEFKTVDEVKEMIKQGLVCPDDVEIFKKYLEK